VIGWLLLGGSVLFGFLVGRWWAPVVPLLLSVIAYRRDHADYEGGDTLDFLVLPAGVFYAVLVLLGGALRKRKNRSSDRTWYPPS
jgi:hypothetical protein